MAKRTAEITGRKRLLDAFFKVDELTIGMTTSAGQSVELKRLVFERGHAAAVLPYDPVTDNVVLISEMRPGILSTGDDPFSFSVVAGMIDPGEDGLKTVFREAIEEAGISITQTFQMHKGAYVSPGGTSEKIALYCGIIDSTKVKPFAGKSEEGEDIQTHVMQFNEFKKLIKRQEINDMKTIVTAMWLEKHRPGLRRMFAKAPQAVPTSE